MVRIAITQAAFEAIAKTLPLGSVGYENKIDEDGNHLIWLDRAVVDRLLAMRGPGESYSDVILRLAAADMKQGADHEARSRVRRRVFAYWRILCLSLHVREKRDPAGGLYWALSPRPPLSSPRLGWSFLVAGNRDLPLCRPLVSPWLERFVLVSACAGGDLAGDTVIADLWSRLSSIGCASFAARARATAT
jgi:hypothetical protein